MPTPPFLDEVTFRFGVADPPPPCQATPWPGTDFRSPSEKGEAPGALKPAGQVAVDEWLKKMGARGAEILEADRKRVAAR